MALSLDDTHERMQLFARALANFQETLEASMAHVERLHGAIDGLWQDEMRARYDAMYAPYHEDLLRYARTQGPEYARFLSEKIQALDEYLHG